MSSAERLESLKEWAEGKKYVYPGESGTLPSQRITGGANTLATAVSSSNSQTNDKYGGQYEVPLGPPSYTATTSNGPPEKKKSLIGKWFGKRKVKKDSAPAYTP